ncbi:uncharacterized protein TNCV_5045801 [Trichonephila clavipes]|uniref:Uncharacterized protein n=1 Tax=Trichonephila clavipes TaxID=2585209 RepID=A0A8X7BKE6_TRICX|nr:uncharacterized protein TNCV_5045801 [Trichonephila clavipes]
MLQINKKNDINSALFILLRLDESIGIAKSARLAVFARYCVGNIIKEELIAITSLLTTTKGTDICTEFKELSETFRFIMYPDVISFDKLNLSQFDWLEIEELEMQLIDFQSSSIWIQKFIETRKKLELIEAERLTSNISKNTRKKSSGVIVSAIEPEHHIRSSGRSMPYPASSTERHRSLILNHYAPSFFHHHLPHFLLNYESTDTDTALGGHSTRFPTSDPATSVYHIQQTRYKSTKMCRSPILLEPKPL